MQTITVMKTLLNSKLAKLIFIKTLNAFNESLNHLTKNWKKMTSLVVAGSLLFGMIMPPISFASSLSQKKDQLREPLTIQMGKAKSNIYRTDENHRLRKESGFREGGKLASESKVLALAAQYIPVDQFSKVSQAFSKQVKEQIRRASLISDQSSAKHIPTGHFANLPKGIVKQIEPQSKDFLSISQSITNQVSHFVSRVSALHAGDIHGLLVRNREKHALNITQDEWSKFRFRTNFKQSLSDYLEIYFEKYKVKGFEEMTNEEIKEGKKPLTQEESETIKEIELVFEEEVNMAFRYVGITRVKVALWEGPGMVENEDVWMLAPLFITDTSETIDSKYVPYHWVRNETGRSFINRGIIQKWIEMKKKYGIETMLGSIKVYVVRELGAQVLMDMQRGIDPQRIILGGEVLKKQYKDIDEIGKEELRRRVEKIGSREGFDLAHFVVEGNDVEAVRLFINHLEIGFSKGGFSKATKNIESDEDEWYQYASLALAVIEGWSLDHKGLMELGKRVANDIRLGDFADYVYVRDLVDSMLEVDVPSPINPLGLFGEFLKEMYENVRDGKNGIGDYAKALNDIFNLIRRNKEFYLQYKELMEKALGLLKDKGKNWKEIGLHKVIPIPGDEESLKPLMKLIRELEKGNDSSQGIVKVVGTVLVILSSVLIGQEVLANGLVPAISSGLSFIDIAPIITGGSGFLLLGHQLGKESQNKSTQLYKGQENQNYPSSDVVDPYIERTAQFLGDSELVKSLFSFYQTIMGTIEEPGVRFLANIKDLMENPAKLNELKSFAEESAGNASVIGNSSFNLSQDGQDNSRETARPYELVIITDENKVLSKKETINFLKRYQVPTEYVRVIHHPFKDEMFDLKSLVEKPENKLIEDGYSLRVINNKYWLIIKELLKNSSIINGLELLELHLKSKESTDESA